MSSCNGAIACKDAEQASSCSGDTAVKMQGKRATVKMAANMGRKAKI